MGDAELSALRAIFDANSARADWAEWAVGIGLLIELGVLFAFSKSMEKAEKIALVLANVVIVLGVLASAHFTSIAADAAGKLQTDATTKAANAIRDAGAANERAAVLDKEAADEKQRAAAIMRATAWRQFTQEQIASLTRSFSQSAGKLTVSWSPNDTEALGLAIQFSNIFQEAKIKEKWELSIGSQPAVVRSIVWGIDIPDVPNANESVAAVRKAFSDAGVSFQTEALPQHSGVFFGGTSPEEQNTRATIFFGSKRPSFGQPPL